MELGSAKTGSIEFGLKSFDGLFVGSSAFGLTGFLGLSLFKSD